MKEIQQKHTLFYRNFYRTASMNNLNNYNYHNSYLTDHPTLDYPKKIVINIYYARKAGLEFCAMAGD